MVTDNQWGADQNAVYDGDISAIDAGVAAYLPGVSLQALYDVIFAELKNPDIYCGYPLHGHS